MHGSGKGFGMAEGTLCPDSRTLATGGTWLRSGGLDGMNAGMIGPSQPLHLSLRASVCPGPLYLHQAGRWVQGESRLSPQ